MTTETFTQYGYDFAHPAVPGGLDAGLPVTSNAVTLADGRVMVLTTDDRTFITATAP